MVAGGGMSGAMPAASAAPNTNTFAPAPSGDMEKVKRRIGWLNANGNLQGPLVFDKVGMLLVSIGDAQAMDILKKLEEHALEVRDPTGWVVTAARTCASEQAIQPQAHLNTTQTQQLHTREVERGGLDRWSLECQGQQPSGAC